MRRRYRTNTLIISIILLCATLCTQSAFASTLPKGIITLDGRDAPALKLIDMEDASFDLKKSRGHWVFVHFWATWCGPCRREMPTIQAMSEKLSDSNLEIVLVNTAESEDTIFGFLGIVAPDLNPLLDSDGLATEAWQPRGLPATFFVSPEGKLRYLALGGRDWDKAEYLTFLKNLK